MLEIRNDMLPDKSEKEQAVEETIIPESSTDVNVEDQSEEKVEIPKGFVPYDALHQERQKRKELEAKLLEIKLKETSAPEPADETYSDEGRALKNQIDLLNAKVSSYEKKEEESKVYSSYPIIKDKKDEFQDYLEENPELSLEKAAKLFIFENNLSTAPVPERKGLERPTGGSKKTSSKGYTEEDVKRLRETEPRKYIKLIRAGKLNPEEIG
jgi:hypothetical protein